LEITGSEGEGTVRHNLQETSARKSGTKKRGGRKERELPGVKDGFSGGRLAGDPQGGEVTTLLFSKSQRKKDAAEGTERSVRNAEDRRICSLGIEGVKKHGLR